MAQPVQPTKVPTKAPPHGYQKPEGHTGPHRSDPDYGTPPGGYPPTPARKP